MGMFRLETQKIHPINHSSGESLYMHQCWFISWLLPSCSSNGFLQIEEILDDWWQNCIHIFRLSNDTCSYPYLNCCRPDSDLCWIRPMARLWTYAAGIFGDMAAPRWSKMLPFPSLKLKNSPPFQLICHQFWDWNYHTAKCFPLKDFILSLIKQYNSQWLTVDFHRIKLHVQKNHVVLSFLFLPLSIGQQRKDYKRQKCASQQRLSEGAETGQGGCRRWYSRRREDGQADSGRQGWEQSPSDIDHTNLVLRS